MDTHVCACMYTHVDTCICLYMHAHVCTCKHTHVHAGTWVTYLWSCLLSRERTVQPGGWQLPSSVMTCRDTIPLRNMLFSMNRLLWHPKPALARFYDFSWPPLKRAYLVTDFTFYSFLRLFSGPISPICCFLRCFYRAQKPDPQKVTKSYERVTKSYERVTKSYEKLQKVTKKLRNTYKKLRKLQTSYERSRT